MAKKIQRQEVEVIKYRKEPTPTLGYTLLNAMFSTLIFVFVYFLYILPRERDILSFVLLFALNLVAGMVGSMIARIFTSNWTQFSKTGIVINRTLINSLIYSIIVFFGLFAFVMERYVDLNEITVAAFLIYMISRDFLEIVAILLAMKVVVYLFSDFMANKLSIGG
jgi:uncharacterized membrane protein YeaQ/YmgE (transglycosylase-associated protein family)